MSHTLADLKPGQRAVIAGFTESGPLVHRMMQLGLLEGSEVELIRRAPAGDPIEIRVLGYSLSLRRSEASAVLLSDPP